MCCARSMSVRCSPQSQLPFGPLGNIGGDHGRMERGSGRQRHQRRRDRHTRFRECLARLRPEIIVLEAATARVRHHPHPMASATSAGASQTSQVARTLTVRARSGKIIPPRSSWAVVRRPEVSVIIGRRARR